MALLSIFRGTQAECSARPVSDGTLLFATDTKKIYLDKDSSRIEMSSVDDLGNYVTKEQLTTALNGKANTTHTHTQDQITGLKDALAGKASASHTHSAASSSASGFMSAADKQKLDALDIVTITKSLKLTTAWMDTGISGNNLSSTGTYVVQVQVGVNAPNAGIYSEIWSGVFSWYASATNSTEADEILLHNAGHAPNNNEIYLRTCRNNRGVLKLQIASKIAPTAASNITFKFRRLI